MASTDFSASRDKGLEVRRYVFQNGPFPEDRFAYTDASRSATVTGPSRVRLLITIDRGVDMATRDRLTVAKSAVVTALNAIRARLVSTPGTPYDICLEEFAEFTNRIQVVGATTAWIDTAVAWVQALEPSTEPADYSLSTKFPLAWFSDPTMPPADLIWAYVSAGLGVDATIPAAFHDVLDLRGAHGAGVRVDPILVRHQDSRSLRFLRGAQAGAVEVIEQTASDVILRRIDAARAGVLTYESVAIESDPIKANGAPSENDEVKIRIARDSALAAYYRDNNITGQMFVTMLTGQADDPERQFTPAWAGRVLSVQAQPGENHVEIICRSYSSAFKRTGLRRPYQYGCPHLLYGDLCKASFQAASRRFTPAVSVWVPTSRVLSVPADVLGSDGEKFIGGVVQWRWSKRIIRRSIVRVQGTNFFLNGPIEDAYGTSSITLAYGCPHTEEGCRTHVDSLTGGSNIVNYGGQPKIPVKNPFRFVSNYY